MNQVGTFVNSTIRWQQAGRPVRTDEEVQAIYDNHCSKCEFLVDQKCTFSCRCNIVAPAKEKSDFFFRLTNWIAPGLFNKLRRATEHCPQKLW